MAIRTDRYGYNPKHCYSTCEHRWLLIRRTVKTSGATLWVHQIAFNTREQAHVQAKHTRTHLVTGRLRSVETRREHISLSWLLGDHSCNRESPTKYIDISEGRCAGQRVTVKREYLSLEHHHGARTALPNREAKR